VLKVDAWIKFHPGGDKSIKHMVGRDATDEINAYGYRGILDDSNLTTDVRFCIGYIHQRHASECCLSRSVASRDRG
jgi:cytochrome b involved in lipid metabolism